MNPNKTAAHLPWIEKYRPKNLNDLVSQKNIIETLNKFIDSGQLPHLLFYGPPGSGKTSAILACAKKVYGNHSQFMVLELNASDTRGIDEVRTRIRDFADTHNFFVDGVKLVILDEADNMTKDAQAALRRVIEKYTKNVRFCLICNYISKIIPALQSRCTRFRFSPLQDREVLERLKDIIQEENISITQKALRSVLRIGTGDMRKILNIIQSASITHNPIKEKHIYMITGKPSPKEIDQIFISLMNDSLENSLNIIQKIQSKNGLDLSDIVKEIYERMNTFFLENDNLKKECYNYFLKQIADLENDLSTMTDSELQLGSLVATFQIIRYKSVY